jgi:hypothetical protein
MREDEGRATTCPGCAADLADHATVKAGRFAVSTRLGVEVDGVRLAAPKSVHVLLSQLILAGGRVVTDDAIASAMEYRGLEPDRIVATIASRAKSLLKDMGIDEPFTRVWSKGHVWTQPNDGLVRTRADADFCPDCGCNLRGEQAIACGVFSHDPATGLVSVGDVKLAVPRQVHATIATLMRAKGAPVRSFVIADRLGSDSEQPDKLIASLLCHARRAMRRHGGTMPIQTIPKFGHRWTGAEVETRYHGPQPSGRVFLGDRTGPDLTTVLKESCGRRLACGCDAPSATVSSDGWSWSQQHGLVHADGSPPMRHAGGQLIGRIMAASGRFVHSEDVDDVVGMRAKAPGNHMKVTLCKLRSTLAQEGLTLPLETKSKQGVRWTGTRPVMVEPEPSRPCASCPPRALTGQSRLMAEALRDADGMTLSRSRLVDLIGSKGSPKLVDVLASRIRQVYRQAGLPDPIACERGEGLSWVVGRGNLRQGRP